MSDDVATTPPAEPTRKPFRGASKLSPEARLIISQQVSQSGGRKSVADMKIDIVRNILREDLDGNGLSKADFYYTTRSNEAQMRLQGISQIFRSDFDGDAVVTKAEFDRTMKAEQLRQDKQMREMQERRPEQDWSQNRPNNSQVLRALTMFLNADSDNNAEITLIEAYLAPNEMSRYRSQIGRPDENPAFGLDFNKDDIVTKEEIEAGVDLFVAEAKESGVIFPEITEVDVRRPSPVFSGNSGKNCNLMQPSRGAKIVRLSAYEGEQLSNISLAGQDEETTTSEIRIEPGKEPLFIIASSYEAQIWRFTGAVGRIEHVILSAWQKNPFGQPAAGLTGTGKTKLSVTTPDCIGGYYKPADNGIIEKEFGRQPDVSASVYGLAGMSVPSKAEYKLKPSRPASLASTSGRNVEGAWKAFTRFTPAGVFQFNPAEVVVKGKAERYEVLPHQAGLVQLLLSGAIQASGDGYIVRKPMRFPGSMGGAHSTTFIVPVGVPMPTGSRSHNCVKQGGQSVGPACR